MNASQDIILWVISSRHLGCGGNCSPFSLKPEAVWGNVFWNQRYVRDAKIVEAVTNMLCYTNSITFFISLWSIPVYLTESLSHLDNLIVITFIQVRLYLQSDFIITLYANILSTWVQFNTISENCCPNQLDELSIIIIQHRVCGWWTLNMENKYFRWILESHLFSFKLPPLLFISAVILSFKLISIICFVVCDDRSLQSDCICLNCNLVVMIFKMNWWIKMHAKMYFNLTECVILQQILLYLNWTEIQCILK